MSVALFVLLAQLAPVNAAGVQFHQSVDRTQVALNQKFLVTIVAVGAGEGATIEPGVTKAVEVLSRSLTTKLNYTIGGVGGGILRTRTLTLVVRAARAGSVILPPATLIDGTRTHQTEPITLIVVK